MPQKISPFLEGKYGWNFGESGWNTGVDENFLKFCFLFDANIDAVVSTLPSPIINGKAYFLSSDNRLYFAVDGIWYSTPTPKWFVIKIRETGELYQFDGSSLVAIQTSQEIEAGLIEVQATIDELGTAAYSSIDDFATPAQLDVAVSQVTTYTDNLFDALAANGGASNVGYLADLSVEDKLREHKSFADFGAIGDGLSHPLSERFATLAEAQAVYPFAAALTEEIDRCAIQLAVNTAVDNVTLIGGAQRYQIDAPVTLTDKGPIRIVGGVYNWPATFSNVFKLEGECYQPQFMFCIFLGDGVPRSTMGAIGCSSGTITHDLKISCCRFDKVPFGAYINADLSGTHYNPEVSDCTFIDSSRYLDDTSGSGLGLVFAEGGTGRIVNGVSRGNTFIRTGRHALYISNGGNVRSIGDRFLGHRDDGSPLIQEGGAIQISRNAKNVTVLCPVFEACKDTCISITSVVTNAELTYPENIKVFNPIFKGNFGALMRLGNDSPSVNGVLSYVDIRDIEIWNQGEAAGAAISILSGTNISIDGVTVREFAGASRLSQIIRLFGYGTVAETNKISIKNVKGTFQNSSGSAVYVDTRVCTGTALVELNNIDTSGIPINYQSAVTNTNIRQDCAPGLIRDFPRSNTDPNGVYAADPGTLFVSRAGANRSVWVKESLFGTSGWSLLKTRLVGKSTTTNRPTLTSSAYDVGTMYMDTTLNANGKPIWWNGAAWVDSSGALV